MKKTTKKILTASVAGTLTLMGATPPKGPADETTPSTQPQVKKRGGAILLKGPLAKENGKYYVTDEATKTKVEISGKDLDRFVGKNVSVDGKLKSGSAAAPALVSVTKIGSATTATAASTATGISTGAIVGGTAAAAAGTIGGLYAAGTLTEEKSASRP